MDESTRRLLALSTKQRGLVTRAQLFACGRTARQIDHALTADLLTRVQFGVYRVAGTAMVEDGDLAAGLLLTDGVASHRSAAMLLNLVEAGPSTPEITVGAKQSQRAAGLILHRSRDLAQVARPGRPGVTALRRVLELRTPRLAAAESELELLIWRSCAATMRPPRTPGRTDHRRVRSRGEAADPLRRSRRSVAAEPHKSDGFGVHSTRSAFESDRNRQNKLVVAGWLPLLFTWLLATNAEEEVAPQVRAALVMRRQAS